MMVYGKNEAAGFLAPWLADKRNIVLVTGRASYTACGAKAFFEPFLAGKSVTHLVTVGENARAEDVAEKRGQLPPEVDAYLAVGGGTAMDTAKLVRGLEGALPEGQTSVGTALDLKHIAATPVGMDVRAVAKLTAVDGKKLTFEIEAFDEAGQIGSAVHERFLVNEERFLQKAYDKL